MRNEFDNMENEKNSTEFENRDHFEIVQLLKSGLIETITAAKDDAQLPKLSLAAEQTDKTKIEIAQYFDEAEKALGHPRYVTGPNNDELENAAAFIKKAIESNPEGAKQELELRKSKHYKWSPMNPQLDEAFETAQARIEGKPSSRELVVIQKRLEKERCLQGRNEYEKEYLRMNVYGCQ